MAGYEIIMTEGAIDLQKEKEYMLEKRLEVINGCVAIENAGAEKRHAELKAEDFFEKKQTRRSNANERKKAEALGKKLATKGEGKED